jgi:HPt (histidine-containing phosphotransfer) domain-containing protein
MSSPKHILIDIEVLNSLAEIEADLPRQVIETFLDSALTDVEKIKEAAQKKDSQALVAAAHGLKSAAANVGAMELSDLCFQLEQKGRQRQASDSETAEICAQLLDCFSRSISTLKVWGLSQVN